MIVIVKQVPNTRRTQFVAIGAQPPSSAWRYEPLGFLLPEPANDNHTGFGEWLLHHHHHKAALSSFILAVLVGAGLAHLI